MTCAHTHVCTVYMYVCVYIYIYICVCVYIYVCVCIYIYIYTHTHTHMSCMWCASYCRYTHDSHIHIPRIIIHRHTLSTRNLDDRSHKSDLGSSRAWRRLWRVGRRRCLRRTRRVCCWFLGCRRSSGSGRSRRR
jgi:hypothetical protein